MTTSENRIGSEVAQWIVGTLAPWYVSPHPNFGLHVSSPAQLWALVVEGRMSDYETAREAEEAASLNSSAAAALMQGLNDDSHEVGLAELLALLKNTQDRGPGQSAALHLAASVLLSEDDRPTEAARLLRSGLATIHQDPMWLRLSPGTRTIIESSMTLQLAIRYLDAGREMEARRAMRRLDDIRLQTFTPRDFQDFPVSPGTSLDPIQVQLDILDSLRAHALAIDSRLEDWNGKGWVTVVKMPLPRVDGRVNSMALASLRTQIKSSFEDVAASNTPIRRLYRDDPIYRPLYASMLIASLGGDLFGANTLGATIASMTALEKSHGNREWAVRESIRLSRQCRDFEGLKRTLRFAGSDGPLMALRSEGQAVLRRIDRGAAKSAEDFQVLQASAPLMPPADIARVLSLASSELLQAGQPPKASARGSWAREVDREALWLTLQRCTRALSQNRELVAVSAKAIRQGAPNSFTEARALTSILQTLTPADVADQVDEIRELANLLRKRRETELSAALSALLVPRGAEDRLQDVRGLELAMLLVEDAEVDFGPPPEKLVSAAFQAAQQDLLQTLASARGGSHSFGGYDAGALLMALCDKFKLRLPWRLITDYVLEPSILAMEKEWLLNGLSRRRRRVPGRYLEEMKASWAQVLRPEGQRIPFFASDAELPVSGPALRAGLALGVLSVATALQAFMELAASSSPVGRGEAAASLPAFGLTADGRRSSPTSALLLLSFDPDPSVRARAGLSLLEKIRRESTPYEAERLSDLLQEDAVTVPLSLARSIARNPIPMDPTLLLGLRQARSNHASIDVRLALEEITWLA